MKLSHFFEEGEPFQFDKTDLVVNDLYEYLMDKLNMSSEIANEKVEDFIRLRDIIYSKAFKKWSKYDNKYS